MAITIAAIAAESSEATNRDIMSINGPKTFSHSLHRKEEIAMKHTRKILLPVILMIALFLSGLFLYYHRIRKEIYEKNSDHLLATYE